MTKQHFIKLAAALRRSRDALDAAAYIELVENVASVCAETNSQFNRARFRDACHEEK